MKDINQVVITSRLTKDAEQRQTTSGKVVQSFSVAINDDYKAKDSKEWTKRAYFINVSYFGNLVGLTKGVQVLVCGKLATSTSDTENGKKVYTKVESNNVYLVNKVEPVKTEEKEEVFETGNKQEEDIPLPF